MIERKEILHKEYDEDKKTCIGFQYVLNDTDITKDEPIARFIFRKSKIVNGSWKSQAYLRDSFTSDLHNLLQFTFQTPKDDMSIEMVCAIGLNLFQNLLKQQIQDYSNLDFAVGEIIRGM